MTIVGALLALNIGVVIVTRLKKPSAVTADGITSDAAAAAVAKGQQPERFEFLLKVLRGRKEVNKIQRDIVTAGMFLKTGEFMAANLVFLVASVVGMLWWINTHMVLDTAFVPLVKRTAAIAFSLWFGWKGPQMLLGFLANKRRSTLEYQLVDALAIISSGLKGGYSFVQGLDMASQQLESPIKDEVARVMRLVQLGLDTPRALLALAERVNSYDFDMTVSATNIQLSVGGNLSQLLEGIAATIRDRIRLRRDIAALTAQGRISGGILIALPLGIAFFLKIINPEYMDYLFKTDMGMNLLYGAALQQACGIYWIKKLLDFDN
jgi:tight adherence protein B